MTEALYLLGAPGVGKSTLIDAYRAAHGWVTLPDPMPLNGKLLGHPMVDATGNPRGVYLGKHRKQFPGTDALSMAVAPDARAWAATLEGRDLFVLGEGARLGNFGFLRALSETTTLTIVLMTATEDQLAARRSARGSTQTPSWMRGAATGAANAYAATTPYAQHALIVDTSELTPQEIVGRL